MRSSDDLLGHMRQAASDACAFVEGLSKEDFLEDKRTQQAVVIGLYPLVPWRNIRGMRNRIAHGYFETDFSIVWDTVQQALPELLEALS